MSGRFAILICRGPTCGGDQHKDAGLHAAFEAALREGDPLPLPAELGWYSCFGRCRRGPNVLVREIVAGENPMLVRMMPTAGPRAVLYHGVTAADVREVIEQHLRNGKKLQHLIDRNAPTPPAPTSAP